MQIRITNDSPEPRAFRASWTIRELITAEIRTVTRKISSDPAPNPDLAFFGALLFFCSSQISFHHPNYLIVQLSQVPHADKMLHAIFQSVFMMAADHG